MATVSQHLCPSARGGYILQRDSLSRKNARNAEPDLFNGKSYRLVADSTIPELQILAWNGRKVLTTCGLRRFRIRRSSPGYGLIGTKNTPGRGGAEVSLIIHSGFLRNGPEGRATESTSDALEISDGPLEELAMGLLLSGQGRQLSSYATTYAVGMLCDRLQSRLSEVPVPSSGRLQEWQISAIHTFLSANLVAPMSVSDLAQLCRLSNCQFSRLFKVTYGSPFYQVVLRERVKRAMHSLRNSEAPLSEIALDCGFSDQSCFTRRFTMITGSSPGLWRKRSRQQMIPAGPHPAGKSIFAQGQA